MNYTLGLDIGITSVGWCVLNLNEEKKPARIADLGVRIFPKAEDPKTGASLALPRRLARGMRRRIKRRAQRLKRIRRLFVRSGIADKAQVESILACSTLDPYKLRAEGLDRLLEKDEWIKALYHIAVRRGFKSNRKSEAKDSKSEGGKLLAGVEHTKTILQANKYRTIGEMFCKDEQFQVNKRNKEGNYSHTVARDLLVEELQLLFKQQRQFANPYASEQIEQEFITIFSEQKHFAEGEQILKMLGFCRFENEKNSRPNQYRAPKASYSAELFDLLDKLINKTRIHQKGSIRQLNIEQIQALKTLALQQAKVTYKQARKALALSEEDFFAGLSYKDKQKDPEEKTLIELKNYHELRKTIEKQLGKTVWLNLAQQPDKLDAIAEGLTYYKTDTSITEYLQNKNVEQEIIDVVLNMSFSKVIHLSLLALHKLLPYLEQGKRYDEACAMVGYTHYQPTTGEKSEFLPLLDEEINNPVVKRALHQTRKVINAIVAKYGSPYQINIELARDLNKPFDERQKIVKGQEEFQAQKAKAAQMFYDKIGRQPTGSELLKFRLWEEQKEMCPYSGEIIKKDDLLKNTTQIDHIIPYSRSFDDSLTNKVLVLAKQNQDKQDKTPYEFFGNQTDKWHKFETWVLSNLRGRKVQNLLLKDSAEIEGKMKERNLNDTRYITTYLAKWLKANLLFSDKQNKVPVKSINGQMTASLRNKWGLMKVREQSDLHHALDAAVVAASDSMVQKVAIYAKQKRLNKATKEHFPLPWHNFRKELLARLSNNPAQELIKAYGDNYSAQEVQPVFVSRMPNRKAGGAIHKETIRSKRTYWKDGQEIAGTAIKTPLSKVKLKDLENMVGKERDYKLYQAIKERLQQFDDKPDKAFAQPLYKPTNDGKQGPLVRSIKIFSAGTAGVPVGQGVADNDRMVRVDVYYKEKRYHLVPVYVADIVHKKVKNKAIVANKPEEEWTVIDNSFEFLFSLFYNDLVEVDNGKDLIFGYYIGCHRGTGNINLIAHDRNKNFGKDGVREGIGVKTAKSLRKFSIDVLGQNISEIVKEKAPYELA